MCNSAQLSFSRKPQIPTPGDELLAVAPCGGSDEHITFIVPAELGTTPLTAGNTKPCSSLQ